MALADDIRTLRDGVQAELTSVHDYFSDTAFAWRFVEKRVADGEAVIFRNPVTGSVTTEKELPDKAPRYVTDYLTSATFQQFVTLFEDFFFGLLRLWLTEFPRSISGDKQIPFNTILDAPDKAAIVRSVVDRELNELAYARLADWFEYFNKRAKLGRPTADEIVALAEIKASRDVLVHNRGVVNKVYLA